MRSFRYNKGFTLGEVLIAVAVLALLVLLATPGILDIRRDMEEMAPSLYLKVAPLEYHSLGA